MTSSHLLSRSLIKHLHKTERDIKRYMISCLWILIRTIDLHMTANVVMIPLLLLCQFLIEAIACFYINYRSFSCLILFVFWRYDFFNVTVDYSIWRPVYILYDFFEMSDIGYWYLLSCVKCIDCAVPSFTCLRNI